MCPRLGAQGHRSSLAKPGVSEWKTLQSKMSPLDVAVSSSKSPTITHLITLSSSGVVYLIGSVWARCMMGYTAGLVLQSVSCTLFFFFFSNALWYIECTADWTEKFCTRPTCLSVKRKWWQRATHTLCCVVVNRYNCSLIIFTKHTLKQAVKKITFPKKVRRLYSLAVTPTTVLLLTSIRFHPEAG